MKMNRFLLVAGAMFAVSVVQAQTFTMTSLNTSAVLAFGSSGGSAGPAFNWRVGGSADQLFEQGYYIKIGAGPVRSVNASFVSATQVSPDRIDAFYADAASGLNWNIRFLLTGAASGQTADLAEVVTVNNGGSTGTGFQFFQFNDFDLGGSPSGDTAVVLNSSTIQQTDGAFSATVGVTGIPDIATTGLAFGAGNIRNAMLNGTLTSNPTFTGDAGFIFGYDRQLGVGQSWQMSANKILTVPEPATMTALALGAAALLRRRKKAN